MTAIWQSGGILRDLQEADNGYAFSQYRPGAHLAAPPFRGLNQGITDLANVPQGSWIGKRQGPRGRRPWVNDPVRAVWDEKRGFWRAWVLSRAQIEQDTPSTTSLTVWAEYISEDLITWVYNRQPFYVEGIDNLQMWGGSVVLDTNNTAGYGPNRVIYLVSNPNNSISRWIGPELGLAPVYEKEVLTAPTGGGNGVTAGFRDLRCVWVEEAKAWIGSVTLDYGLSFYSSPDTETWTFLNVIDLSKWQQIECPDLIKMTDQNGNTKWMLFFCLKTWEGNYRQAVAYLPVSWTGKQFDIDNGATPKLFNYGSDYYAQAVFQKEGKSYIWAWMGNWPYSGYLPSAGSVNCVSMVTEITLFKANDGTYSVHPHLLPGQERLYGQYQTESTTLTGDSASWSPSLTTPGTSWRLDATLMVRNGPTWPQNVIFDFCIGPNNYTRLTLAPNDQTATLSRAHSGEAPRVVNAPANELSAWQDDQVAPLPPKGIYQLTIIYDNSAVEIIINETVYLSCFIFPPDDAFGMRFSLVGDGVVSLPNITLNS